MQQPPHNKIGMIPRRPLFAKNPTNPAATAGLGCSFGTGSLGIHAADHEAVQPDGRHDVYRRRSAGRFQRQCRGAQLRRDRAQGRYSWAYLFKRVRNNSQRTQADISIIVYSGRSIDVPTDENAFLRPFAAGLAFDGCADASLGLCGRK